MFIGVDVGGTYTDAVAVDMRGNIIAAYKIPTTENIILCISNALEKIRSEISLPKWERLVISTTKLTNVVAQDQMEKVGVFLIPGPGLNPELIKIPTQVYFLEGAINYRGHEINPLHKKEIREKTASFYQEGYRHLAIVGKFSGRNALHETEIAKIVSELYPEINLTLGHQVTGYLNFPRRCATTWITAATKGVFHRFLHQVNEALSKLNVTCPVFIMKADGGIIPLDKAHDLPGATIYSGPAASTVGAAAILPPDQSAIVMDIGGSTTDLSLVLSGIPLPASKGLKLKELLTQVKSLSLKSIAIGGDSPIILRNGQPDLHPLRQGKAACFGGDYPTLTDAINIQDMVPGIDINRSINAINQHLGIARDKISLFANSVINQAVKVISHEIKNMIADWQEEPAYKVWDIMQKEHIFPNNLIGIGGAAPGLTSHVARALSMKPKVPPFTGIINAVGCSVAKPTLSLQLHIDTQEKILAVQEEETQKDFNKDISLEKAVEMAKTLLMKRAAQRLSYQIAESEIEVVQSEIFNVIRGYSRTGHIIDVEVQIKPDLVTRIN